MAQEFGKLIFHRHEEAGTKAVTVTAEWVGADFVMISEEFIQNSDPRYLQVESAELLTICQFKLRIVGRTMRGDYIAERIGNN